MRRSGGLDHLDDLEDALGGGGRVGEPVQVGVGEHELSPVR